MQSSDDRFMRKLDESGFLDILPEQSAVYLIVRTHQF